jgi:predicted lactoylglutathione lyase
VASKIFVNLPVKNLQQAIDFYTRLGFHFNPQFTDENATCIIVSEHIFVMLLVEKRFSDFTKKQIADANEVTEAIICIDAADREEVDVMVRNTISAGGKIPNHKQDHGWMYDHGFQDLDGHLWEVMWMDESAMPARKN